MENLIILLKNQNKSSNLKENNISNINEEENSNDLSNSNEILDYWPNF